MNLGLIYFISFYQKSLNPAFKTGFSVLKQPFKFVFVLLILKSYFVGIKRFKISVGGGHRVSSKRVPHRSYQYCAKREPIYHLTVVYVRIHSYIYLPINDTWALTSVNFERLPLRSFYFVHLRRGTKNPQLLKLSSKHV